LASTGDAEIDALLTRGDDAFERGEWTAADAAYRGAAQRAPKRAAPMVGVARVRMAKASPDLGFGAAPKNVEVLRAIADLKRAAGLEPTFGPSFVELGRAYLLLGDGERAAQSLETGSRLLDENAEAHSALGIARLALGKVEEAEVELRRARDMDPGSAARRGNLGTVLFMRGRVPEAIAEYEIQARLLPGVARTHSDLGTARLAQSDFEGALAELEKAIALEPKRATFHSNLGYAHQLSGKLDVAIRDYREAIRLDPTLSSAWINLATVLARDPQTRAEARRALQTAAKIDPTDPRVIANFAELDALERGTALAPTRAH
jgi:tetratricopeptide (TPR) repeat protein